METITFKDTESDLAALGRVCRELEDRGLPPNEAAAHVLASMANQAISNGMDAREAIDALHQVINGNAGPQPEPERRRIGITRQQAEEIRAQIKFLQTFQLYWDMVLCGEVQRQVHAVQEELKAQGLYRHELKRYANKLGDETRRMLMLMKDNDRALVIKWCRRVDSRDVYTREFYEDGASIHSKFLCAYADRFRQVWEVVRLDCRNAAKLFGVKHQKLVAGLLELEALTNTGVELFDTCLRKMKALVAGKGTYSIAKSTHHESLRCATHNLLRKLVDGNPDLPAREKEYARKHLADMQKLMVEEGSGMFFQSRFDLLTEDFVYYIMAWVRIDMEFGKVRLGAIRMLFERLGTRHRVEQFFKELGQVPVPEGDADVFDVSESIRCYDGKKPQITRFMLMCTQDKRSELPESEDKQEQRMLRILARRNNYMLPDDILRVMIMKHKTKKVLMERLSASGFELAPTLRRIRKMKLEEIKQL